ncbi:hypothetical protein DFH28DRAFT_1172078, partial [Melampsora americana]
LPALKHLTIWPHAEWHYIHCFSDCKNLCHLAFYHIVRYNSFDNDSDDDSDQLVELHDFVTNDLFPNLKTIALHVNHREYPLDSDIDSTVTLLKEFSKSKGIRFSISPVHIHMKSLHNTMLFGC